MPATAYCEIAMSQQKLGTDVVQTWFATFEEDADAFRSTLHRNIVWFPFEDNHSPSHGVEAAMRIRNMWLDSFDDQEIVIEELVETEQGVLASIHVTARGRSSGVKVDVRLHFHFKLRDGKLVYIYEHQDRRDALEATGLAQG
jgi:ketosteroid isomerase-like protein